MSAPSKPAAAPVRSRADLVAYLEGGCKPRDAWRIGTEHEKFVFRKTDLRRPPYEGADGIRALFEGLCQFGWDPV
jgi:glutamate--cysteine ligase